MVEVSIIVPIYKGKKYVENIIRQIEACGRRINGKVELILVNDYPGELLDTYISDIISIITVNTNVNRGIHGARVRGLDYCNGAYVLMLDQDDIIYEEFLDSQLCNISEADASVCRVKECGRYVYNYTNPFDRVIDSGYMLGICNAIVSPGQVLLRRDAIPDIWKNNILIHNGADDWFLWLCMIGNNKRFALNEDVLFEHIVNGFNTSLNVVEMLQSEDEMCDFIYCSNIFSDREKQKLQNLINNEKERHIHILENYRNMFLVYDKWMRLEKEKGLLSFFLYSHGYKKVAIYGAGYIGMQLARQLHGSGVKVEAIIDINADYIESDLNIIRISNFDFSSDLIIVTPLRNYEEILDDLKGRTNIALITITELLTLWEGEM